MTGSRLVALVACAAAVHGCAPEGQPEGAATAVASRGERDLLLVTIDTLRHDATGYSGSGQVETPALDRLAATGAVFSRAHAHAVVTLPSHASILTGLYPYQHGIHDNAGFVLDEAIPTLATLLRARGFRTAAFVSAFPLDRRFGLDSGFEIYDDLYRSDREAALRISERPDAETVVRAKLWWDEHEGQRRFLWVHLFGPHFPYEPGEPFASRYEAAPYFGDVAQSDAALQPLLEPLAGARVLVVVTSDHGEGLGEKGEHGHGLFAYETTLKVPLLFWAPGLLAPVVDDRSARHVDLVPSILDLLDIELPSELPGRSLFRRGANDAGCYFEALSGALNRGWAPLYGWIEGPMKAIRLPIAELYDLERDPEETTNLAGQRPAELARLLARLPAEATGPFERGQVDEEVARHLRALGYVAGGSGAVGEAGLDASADPKNLIGLQAILDEAAARYRDGDAPGGARLLEQLVERQPTMAVVYSHLATIYLGQGRVGEAVELLRRALAIGIDDESLRTLLAHALLRGDEPERAWELLIGDGGSRNPETQRMLGSIAEKLGRLDEARARFERALELDPTFPAAALGLGLVALRQGRFEEARVQLERALGEDPGAALGWNALGVVRAETDDLQGAVEAWERAAAADPRMPDPLLNLALAYQRLGRSVPAIAALERYLPLVDGPRHERAEALLRSLRGQD